MRMNIFFLSLNLSLCAKYYCDKHVVKIILEITQMLWTAIHLTGSIHPNVPVKIYRPTHKNHPMNIWVRTSPHNFRWTVRLGLALCKEYTNRYHKIHACQPIIEWLSNHSFRIESVESVDSVENTGKTVFATKNIPKNCTPVPLCMPAQYKTDDLIKSYRAYYIGDKKDIAEWRHTERPKWFHC